MTDRQRDHWNRRFLEIEAELQEIADLRVAGDVNGTPASLGDVSSLR